MITTVQQKILDFVTNHIMDKGFAPSVREVGAAMGFASPRAAQKQLAALEEQGLLRRESKARGIKVTSLATMATISVPF